MDMGDVLDSRRGDDEAPWQQVGNAGTSLRIAAEPGSIHVRAIKVRSASVPTNH